MHKSDHSAAPSKIIQPGPRILCKNDAGHLIGFVSRAADI